MRSSTSISTLLDFFQKDVSEFNSEKKIRALYPIVDALSGGQIAGLDFLSIKDMIIMAFTDEKGFNSVDLDKVKPASIYEGVNREIYEKGGVALTDDALRADASTSASATTTQAIAGTTPRSIRPGLEAGTASSSPAARYWGKGCNEAWRSANAPERIKQ